MLGLFAKVLEISILLKLGYFIGHCTVMPLKCMENSADKTNKMNYKYLTLLNRPLRLFSPNSSIRHSNSSWLYTKTPSYWNFGWLNAKIVQKMASGRLLFLALFLRMRSMTCELPSMQNYQPKVSDIIVISQIQLLQLSKGKFSYKVLKKTYWTFPELHSNCLKPH